MVSETKNKYKSPKYKIESRNHHKVKQEKGFKKLKKLKKPTKNIKGYKLTIRGIKVVTAVPHSVSRGSSMYRVEAKIIPFIGCILLRLLSLMCMK